MGLGKGGSLHYVALMVCPAEQSIQFHYLVFLEQGVVLDFEAIERL